MHHFKKNLPLFFLSMTIFAYFIFGSIHLTKFVTADEHYWTYERIPQYWDALVSGKIKKTLINDKPGITIALISGSGLLFEKNPEDNFKKIDEDLKTFDVSNTENVNRAFRLPILIFNGFFLLYFFWIIKKLTDNGWIAAWSAILIGLSPILIGISQIINPDALLWTFSSASIFTFFALLEKKEKKLIWLTALLTGLAILTKYTANILIPFYFLLIFLHHIFIDEDHGAKKMGSYFLERFKQFALVLLGMLATVTFFLPAIWVKPIYLYRATLGFSEEPQMIMLAIMGIIIAIISLFFLDKHHFKNKLFFASLKYCRKYRSVSKIFILTIILIFAILIIGRNIFDGWPLFKTVPFDIKELDYANKLGHPMNFFEIILFEFNPLVFSLTPTILILALFAWTRSLFSKNSPHLFHIFSITIFILFYFAASIMMEVATTVRYSIIIYPLLAFLAAIGLWNIMELMRSKKIRLPILLSLCIFSFSVLSLFLIKPYYFNYTNSLLPKDGLISDAWGYGGYETAQYLNSLENAENLTVWADYYGVCEFFKGRCITEYNLETGKYSIDYYVLTRRGEIRYGKGWLKWIKPNGVKVSDYYGKNDPIWKLEIDGRPENNIRIFKADDELRAAIITDIDHCPSRAPVSTEQLDNFVNFSKEKDADFVISLGDNASHRLRNCSDTADMDARYVADYLRSSGLPTHLVLGDHDIASETVSYQNWLETTGRTGTFYSFDLKDFHIIILDTVLGGEPMEEACSEDENCSMLEARLSDLKSMDFAAYRKKYADSDIHFQTEKNLIKNAWEAENSRRNLTHSWGVRDRGRLSESQLKWLETDLGSTIKSKILVFSDHPLFRFASSKKSYDIVNGDKARDILAKSQKEIVAISGEAHLWHEERQGNIQYYIVDEFRKSNGSWAYFTWDKDGFALTKETH